MKKINALIKICDSILYQERIDAKEPGFFIKIQKIIFCGTARIRKTISQGPRRNAVRVKNPLSTLKIGLKGTE